MFGKFWLSAMTIIWQIFDCFLNSLFSVYIQNRHVFSWSWLPERKEKLHEECFHCIHLPIISAPPKQISYLLMKPMIWFDVINWVNNVNSPPKRISRSSLRWLTELTLSTQFIKLIKLSRFPPLLCSNTTFFRKLSSLFIWC